MASNTISINQAKQLTQEFWQANESVMVWGPPGVGKSDGIRQIADNTSFIIPTNEAVAARSPRLAGILGRETMGRPVYDIRLLLCSPTDLKGIPVYNSTTGRGEWISTNMFPMSAEELAKLTNTLIRHYDEAADPDTDAQRRYALRGEIETLEPMIEKGLKDQFAIIFLDEISVAPKMVQGAALQLVLDRTVGTYRLPDTASIVAAGNRSSDRSGATAMSPPLASRFAHIDVEAPSFDEWLKNFALPTHQPTQIIGFLKFRPALLFDYKPEKMTGSADAPSTFPCPRTWARLGRFIHKSSALARNDDDLMFAAAAGVVGEGAAGEFVAWLNVFNKLPEPERILTGELKTVDFMKIARNPSKTDEPERDVRSRSLSLRYAFFHALASLFTKHTGDYVTGKKAAAGDTKAIATLTKEYHAMAIKFFEFINEDDDDIELTMVILNNYLLRDSMAMSVIGELRSLPSASAKGTVDRIVRQLSTYSNVK